jgi:hypothetical protein
MSPFLWRVREEVYARLLPDDGQDWGKEDTIED